MKKLITVFVFFAILSCSNNSPDKDRIILAKVFDKYLYIDDLEGIIPKGTSPEDSIIIIRNNIDLWVKKQLILNKAEINLKSDAREIEKKIEDYRASLLIYEYKQEFLKQKLDTVVENSEVISYYKNNTESLKLSASVVKAILITIPKTTDDVGIFNRLFFNAKSDSTKIIEFCKRSESKYNDFNKQWILFANLAGLLPIQTENAEILLKSGDKFQYQDQEFYYFLKIKEFKLRGETQPLQFVKDQIKSIILNKRKVELTEELEQNIYQNAVEYKNFEIFNQSNE